MVVFLLHIKIRDAFRRINPDLRIPAARFDYEVVFSLLFPQKNVQRFCNRIYAETPHAVN